MRKTVRYFWWMGGVSEPEYQTSQVLNFVWRAAGTDYVRASARYSPIEINSGSGDQARSYSFCITSDNFNRLNYIAWCIENSARPQIRFGALNDEHATQSGRVYIYIIGNSTFTQYLELYTNTYRLVKGRCYFVTITYDGTATANGIKLYINGAEITDVTKTTVGAYVSAYQDANMRLNLGGSNSVSAQNLGGQISNWTAWDKVLSLAEHNELYNEGPIIRAQDSSFFADCIEGFNLNGNYDNLNSHITLTETDPGSTIKFKTGYIDGRTPLMGIVKSQLNNTLYNAFGMAVQNGNKFWWYGGVDANNHIGTTNSRVVGRFEFDKSQPFETQSIVKDIVITDGSVNVQGGTTHIIDGKVVNFSSRYNGATNTFVNTGRYEGNDGLVGLSFDPIETMATTYARYEFYGKVVEGFASGEYFVPFFEHNGAGTWRLSVFKTTDNGATYSKITVHEGTEYFGEMSLINLGNNTLLGVCRKDTSTYGLYQTVSVDGGNTWSTPVKTNLGGTVGRSNCDLCLGEGGLIQLVFMDRSTSFIWLSADNNPQDILADPLAWNTPTEVFRSYTTDSYAILGYPSIIYDSSTRKYFFCVSAEKSSAQTDLFVGYGRFLVTGYN